jgi:hypothetical protein
MDKEKLEQTMREVFDGKVQELQAYYLENIGILIKHLKHLTSDRNLIEGVTSEQEATIAVLHLCCGWVRNEIRPQLEAQVCSVMHKAVIAEQKN